MSMTTSSNAVHDPVGMTVDHALRLRKVDL